MRVPVDWLREYVAVPEGTTGEAIAASLVAVGLCQVLRHHPGNRVWPVRSCCMVACLRSRFLAISWSSLASKASTSDSAEAIARCSERDGVGY